MMRQSGDFTRSRANAGFTIFEVGMAAAIMALALVSSITVMQRTFNALDTARAITYATQIMQNEMEKMRLQNWTTVSAYPTAATSVTIDSAFTSTSIGSRFLGMTRSVETVHSDTNGGMRKITLTGNANFHYDESLGNFGGGNPFRVSKWKELTTQADRDHYNPMLSF